MSKRKKKAYWEMTASELSAATKAFEDPAYDPPARKATPAQLAQLRRWQQRRKQAAAPAAPAAKRGKLQVSLEQKLIKEADDYAARRGITVSDVVSSALRRLLTRKKSA